MRRKLFPIVLMVVLLAGCEGARNNSSWSTAEKGAEIVPSLQKADSPPKAAADSAAVESSKSSR
jgi:hypothetical protein